MTTLPLADARAHLSKLIDEAATTHARFEITRNGHRTAVLLSADDFDIMQDTIDVLSDADLLTAHHQGQSELAAGEHLSAEQLAAAMAKAGRLPR
jgi:prevent-host-death family protein